MKFSTGGYPVLLAIRINHDSQTLTFIHDCIAKPMFQDVILSDSPENTLSMFRYFKPDNYQLGQSYAFVRRTMRPIDLDAN